jgi:hypothetical protein
MKRYFNMFHLAPSPSSLQFTLNPVNRDFIIIMYHIELMPNSYESNEIILCPYCNARKIILCFYGKLPSDPPNFIKLL